MNLILVVVYLQAEKAFFRVGYPKVLIYHIYQKMKFKSICFIDMDLKVTMKS